MPCGPKLDKSETPDPQSGKAPHLRINRGGEREVAVELGSLFHYSLKLDFIAINVGIDGDATE